MSNESLYNLSMELQTINDELADNGGELSTELEAKMDALSIPFSDKVDGIVRWTKNLEGRELALDAEITRLQARRKATSNLRERLKAYVLDSMVRADRTKLDLDIAPVSVVKNNPSCEIITPEMIPAKYKTIRTEVVIDKKSVLDDLKKGPVEGARLITDKHHLRIG